MNALRGLFLIVSFLLICSMIICAVCSVLAPCLVFAQTWYAEMTRSFLFGDVVRLMDAHLPIRSLVCVWILEVIELRATIAVPPGLYVDDVLLVAEASTRWF